MFNEKDEKDTTIRKIWDKSCPRGKKSTRGCEKAERGKTCIRGKVDIRKGDKHDVCAEVNNIEESCEENSLLEQA